MKKYLCEDYEGKKVKVTTVGFQGKIGILQRDKQYEYQGYTHRIDFLDFFPHLYTSNKHAAVYSWVPAKLKIG